MRATNFNHYGKIFSALCWMGIAGCMTTATEPDTHPARITVDMEVVAPETLAKTSQVVLNRIVVRLVSNKKDTVTDIITSTGSLLSKDPDTFLAGCVASQVVSASYDLPPGRSWKVSARLYDSRDSVRQLDSLPVAPLAAFDQRTIGLCLHPRLTAFSAHFFLPSEIRVQEPSGLIAMRKVFFSRITLLDGDLVKEDSSTVGGKGPGYMGGDPSLLPGSQQSVFFNSGSFDEIPSVQIRDEYVNTGVHTFTLNAYGYIEGDTVGKTPLRLLFKGSQSLNTTLAKSEDAAVSMEWQASDIPVVDDTTSASSTHLRVVLGRVGTLVINVRMSGELDL